MKLIRSIGLLLVFCLIPDCLAATTQPTATEPRAFVLHLNGIGGERSIDRSLIQGLNLGGIKGEYQIYDWTGDEQGMLSLTDVNLHITEAAKVEAMIEARRRAHPHERIILTSHSAGTGIAAWALAELPADVQIDTWVILSSALSPKFDLSKALSHVKGKAFAFSSIHDSLVLGVGTRLMGTVDRVKSDAAGLVGFKEPKTADPVQYAKLVNVPYSDSWLRFGDVGDHIGVMRRAFAANVLAPTILNGVVPEIEPLPTTQP